MNQEKSGIRCFSARWVFIFKKRNSPKEKNKEQLGEESREQPMREKRGIGIYYTKYG